MQKGFLILIRFIAYLLFYNRQQYQELILLILQEAQYVIINSHKVFESFAEIGSQSWDGF